MSSLTSPPRIKDFGPVEQWQITITLNPQPRTIMFAFKGNLSYSTACNILQRKYGTNSIRLLQRVRINPTDVLSITYYSTLVEVEFSDNTIRQQVIARSVLREQHTQLQYIDNDDDNNINDEEPTATTIDVRVVLALPLLNLRAYTVANVPVEYSEMVFIMVFDTRLKGGSRILRVV
ncbi:hypothetical protein BDB00DRAFT_866457 [Zychaea mexicana]|uniref:uncharacterized protein n=1 Tax=Zychaea mexicana TaxID=64656 RepID=UPI0022FE6015|nr:uncharacterized protein BDB00DRAFT_866457 [Zychaea mexicana]KAI9499592.1 hypothetical protein BDB00DRAFT_866457 [Zychaea mexicana]